MVDKPASRKGPERGTPSERGRYQEEVIVERGGSLRDRLFLLTGEEKKGGENTGVLENRTWVKRDVWQERPYHIPEESQDTRKGNV